MNEDAGYKTVTVTFSKGSGETVHPDPVELTQGQKVEWVLIGDADAMEIALKQSEQKPWPFDGSNRPSGGKGKPARTGPMRPKPAGGSYKYDVVLTLSDGGKHTIDPEMILPRPK